MKVRVEFLRSGDSDDVHDISRVPCIGEHITFDRDVCFEVLDVIHFANADLETTIGAIVRVK